ncbi:MAG: hypothetical protein ABR578_10280 [Chromatocurvus sp.]
MVDRADPSQDDPLHSRATAGSEEPGSGPSDTGDPQAQLKAWLALGTQALAVVEQFASLLRLELGLAVADAGRLVMVVLAIIPLVFFAWLGLGLLLAWLVYAASTSVTLALVAFLLLQAGTLVLLLSAARRFQRSLGLPATRRQWQALMRAPSAASGERGDRRES